MAPGRSTLMDDIHLSREILRAAKDSRLPQSALE
jgi:hypothetical protein